MRKIIGLSSAILLLLFSVYSLGILLISIITADSISFYAVFMIALLIAMIIFDIGLCVAGFKRYRIGRFNMDIFTTICLFGTFMFSFLIPGVVTVKLASLGHMFLFLDTIVTTLGTSSIGIYEASLFTAMIACGLTIGEDQKKKYYE